MRIDQIHKLWIASIFFFGPRRLCSSGQRCLFVSFLGALTSARIWTIPRIKKQLNLSGLTIRWPLKKDNGQNKEDEAQSISGKPFTEKNFSNWTLAWLFFVVYGQSKGLWARFLYILLNYLASNSDSNSDNNSDSLKKKSMNVAGQVLKFTFNIENASGQSSSMRLCFFRTKKRVKKLHDYHTIFIDFYKLFCQT